MAQILRNWKRSIKILVHIDMIALYSSCWIFSHFHTESSVLPHPHWSSIRFRSGAWERKRVKNTELIAMFIKPVWDDYLPCDMMHYHAGSSH